MGTILLIVVMAAWAAVLLPPLLRSRAENRPNSSVSDFRAQLSSLQRAVPARSVTVRSMGRSLAPSTLGRPAAAGRPANRQAPSPRGQHSYGPQRSSRAESQRVPEASTRTRSHGSRDASAPLRRPLTSAGNASGAVKRRRANVLFVLVLTTVCGGFLAATTDSKPMLYLFALGMIALGGYVYVLVTLNQREHAAAADAGVAADRSAKARRYVPAPAPAPAPSAQPVQRRAVVPRDPLVQQWRTADEIEAAARSARPDDGRGADTSGADTSGADTTGRPAASRSNGQPVGAYRYRPVAAADDVEFPGSGRSGRISYGRTLVTREPNALPTPRDPSDPFGREQAGRDITRGTPVRNGRHATGQHPVQERRRPPAADRSYSQAG